MPTRDDYRIAHSLRVFPYLQNVPYPRSVPAVIPPARLLKDFANATATMQNLLSLPIPAGVPVNFRAVLWLANSTPGEGFQIDFAGGTVAADVFRAMAILTNNVGTVITLGNALVTTLAGVISQGVVSTTDMLEVSGWISSPAGGNLVLRAAELSHSTGTLTVFAGSSIQANP